MTSRTPNPSREHDAPAKPPARSQDSLPLKRLAEAISTSLRKDRHLVAEAPDSPAWTQVWLPLLIQDALDGRGQVILVTATPERRRRLLEQELPQSTKSSAQAVSVSQLQPLEAYGCLEKLSWVAESDTAQNEGIQKHAFLTPQELTQLSTLFTWCLEGGSGLLSDAPTPLTERVRAFAAVQDAQCLGAACPFIERCPGRMARQQAQDATVLLMDYATFCTSYLKDPRTEPAAPELAFKVVVLLEAHAAAQRVREHLTETLSADHLWELLPSLSWVGQASLALQLQQATTTFFDALSRYRQSHPSGARLRKTHPAPMQELTQRLEEAGAALRLASELPSSRTARLVRMSARAFNLSGQLETCMSLTEHQQVVTLELDAADAVEVRSVPVHVAPALAPLFESRMVMALSDTLAVDGRLEPLCHLLGFPETTQTLIVSASASDLPRLLLVVPESPS